MALVRSARASVDRLRSANQMTSKMKHLIQRAAPVLALCVVALRPAFAQAPTPPQAAASASLPYRSAFADYKPWQDAKPGDWRALNEAVKGDAMTGMDTSGMKGMGDMKVMPDMPGMTDMTGMAAHRMPKPAASAVGHGAHPSPPDHAASMPAMPGMSNTTMGGHP